MPDDRTAKVTKHAMLAFCATLGVGAVLAPVLLPQLSVAHVPFTGAEWGGSTELKVWGAAVGKIAEAVLIFVVGFTGLMLWNFLFQVANPGSIIHRQLDCRAPESPLAEADQVREEGD